MPAATETIKAKRKISKDVRQRIICVVALIVAMAIFGTLSPYFLKPGNLASLLTAAVPLGLIAISETCCLLTGVFDMSVGMTASLGGVLWTLMITKLKMPTYGAFFLVLLIGIVIGLFAGASVTFLSIPAWMATYAVMQVERGFIYIMTNGEAIRMTKYKVFKQLGQHKVLGTPITWAILIMIAAYFIAYFILNRTKLGRDIYVVGGNLEAAKNCGIRIHRTRLYVFAQSSFLAILAGMLFASRSGSGQPQIGDLYAMQAIAGSCVGGVSMGGGNGNVVMTFVGMMLIVVLQNGMNMINVQPFYQMIATGFILIIAIFMQTERPK